MEYAIERLKAPYRGKLWRIFQYLEYRDGRLSCNILLGGIADWDTREHAEAYLERFIAEHNAACARAALGVEPC